MSTSDPHVLTVGETMALLDPTSDGAIRSGMQFSLRVAGAESNFGIALRRLGVPVTWVSRLGADPLGDLVHDTLADQGLDLSYVRREAAPTGLFLKWRARGKTSVVYHRRGSAASMLEPSDVPHEAFDQAALVHLTGITMALSDSARRTVVEVARRASKRAITVLFDPNYRPALWAGPSQAAAVHREVLEFVDWYMCGLEEGSLLWDTSDAESLLDALVAAGLQRAVVRVNEDGALLLDGGDVTKVVPDQLHQVLDEIGAGDGFAAGFAYGLVRGWAPADCARAGHLIAGRALLGTGDWETFPQLSEVESILREIGGVTESRAGEG